MSALSAGENLMEEKLLMRAMSLYDIHRNRKLKKANINDYLLNSRMRIMENPHKGASSDCYQNALFYLYGFIEEMEVPNLGSQISGTANQSILMHGLLRRFEFVTPATKLNKILKNQVIVDIDINKIDV